MKEYLQSVADVLAASGSQKEGLTSQQVAKNLEKYGPNKLEEGKKRPLILRIWDQIKDPMVIILIIAAFISVISGAINGELSESLVDAVIIAVVVVLNACLGIFQESKAEKSIEALQKLSAPTTRVRRNGVVAIINSADIVPGDIVLLEAGDSVPADMRIIESASLKVEEAALTGESVPVEKQIDAITVTSDDEVPLGDRINMAYMGTNIAYGRGEGVVIGTGMNTEMGKIATILSSGVDEKTPLQIKLAGLSKFLSIAVLAICVLVFAVSLGKYAMTANGFDLSSIGLPQALESLLLAVSLAVAAIPEGLVVVVTIVLSIGVSRMSQRNSIIRRLTAVETLGCTQTICSDKTGTLTQNKMTVTAAYGDEKFLATAMSLCTDVQKDENGVYVGDPTEIALVDFNDKINGELPAQPRVGEAPFDSVRKKMSTVHDMGDGTFRQYTKGGLDEVLTGCTKIYKDGKITDITAADKEAILTENKSMAQRALRVLACSYRDYSQKPTSFAAEDLETDLIFVGIVGMIDPVRPEVKAAIEECNQAGIRAVMITGDHKDTAIAIAKELGILQDESQAITGAELSKMSDEEFEKRVKTISVYARVQPEHKVRIVTMWKKIGKITAMTGDGVNDAP
ncbi:MAG: HAD-IC family P-type ATPase, partial [Oscillospiraceae bacterium]|nr:HAD-IC family P-type ATPase [Oscillospiraceae bacterium]